ncbi:hypothetical protein HON36_04290 [Candidatus Parcubacteria bacterium]|jgi:hypothetical protein|nr:hypothetical protein [Candidatus Parcubacteria bacterium]MBT7228499.1 hypothetical protein [Candidatus Parcubacteria bacterium]
MQEDKNTHFSKLTPESIVLNYIMDMQTGDFGILDEVKSAIHQQVALELIKTGQAKLLSDNMDKFRDINVQQIAETIIESGDNFLAKQVAKQSMDVDFEDISKLIDKI